MRDLFSKDQRRLVKAIYRIFLLNGKTRMRTSQILEFLNSDPSKPWATYCGGKNLTARRLHQMLDDFEIHSQNVRFPEGVFKGFAKKEFRDAKRLLANQ